MRMSNTRSMRPGRGLITTTRSASSTASSIECVMNTTVLRVDSHSASRSRRICSRVSASSAPNGSSNSSSGASWISARAIATRWRMPPDSSCGKRSTKSASPTCASSRNARSRYARGLRPRSSTCTSTLSSTFRQSSSTGLWNTMPTSVCGRSTSRPPTRASPGARQVQARDDPQQRALAAARRADDREEFAFADRKVDRVERMRFARRRAVAASIGLRDAGELDVRARRLLRRRRLRSRRRATSALVPGTARRWIPAFAGMTQSLSAALARVRACRVISAGTRSYGTPSTPGRS